jgi:hypothetical protein
MSEIDGYFIAYSSDENVMKRMGNDFSRNKSFLVDDFDFTVLKSNLSDLLKFEIIGSEYSDEQKFTKQIVDEYKPNLLITNWCKKAYLNGEMVSKKTAYEELTKISSDADFYMAIERENFSHALELLKNKAVSLNDSFNEIEHSENCLASNDKGLFEYAIENGFANHLCKYCDFLRRNVDEDRRDHVIWRLTNFDDFGLYKKLIDLGGDPNGPCLDGVLLHYIIDIPLKRNEIIELIQLLFEKGAEFNKLNYENDTPLVCFIEQSIDDDWSNEDILLVTNKMIECGAKVGTLSDEKINVSKFLEDNEQAINQI